MKLNIATLITLIAVVDHSPYRVLATAKTSETISKQEDDAVSVLPLLRGVKNAVYQFLSDSDSEELSCVQENHVCQNDDDCCEDMLCFAIYPRPGICKFWAAKQWNYLNKDGWGEDKGLHPKKDLAEISFYELDCIGSLFLCTIDQII